MAITRYLLNIIPYISGLYTLPWIAVGFIVTSVLAIIIPRQQIDNVMKKIGRVILFCFVPVLVFIVFLDTKLGRSELRFMSLALVSIAASYFIAFVFARYMARRNNLGADSRILYLKTVITNQGRSSAFVGGIMLAISDWGVPAGIYMALTGISLFAIVPYILTHLEAKNKNRDSATMSLPGFLKVYPWYFMAFVIAAIFLQKGVGINTKMMGDWGIILRFYAALTIPAALYYVGSGIHVSDMKIDELKKLLGIKSDSSSEHWQWVRQIFVLTSVITPLFFAISFGFMRAMGWIPVSWFAVTLINMSLPITGTNMFLIPYGLDHRATAHAITWSTLINVPLVVILIEIFSLAHVL